MSQPTSEELAFLRLQRIPLSQVFDASGMKRGEYSEAMRAGEFAIAFGTKPCAKGAHTLRTRSGHCVQCNSANIAFQGRFHNSGYVYLAGSPGSGLLKIGTTSDLNTREWQLRNWKYGGAADWEILISSFVQNAGSAEFAAQDRLREKSESGSYSREGRIQECYELFRCSFDEARDALLISIPANSAAREPNLERVRKLWP